HFHARLTRNAKAPVLAFALVHAAFVAGSQSAQNTIVPFAGDPSEVNATVLTWRLPLSTVSPEPLIRKRSVPKEVCEVAPVRKTISAPAPGTDNASMLTLLALPAAFQIGRASCREREWA